MAKDIIRQMAGIYPFILLTTASINVGLSSSKNRVRYLGVPRPSPFGMTLQTVDTIDLRRLAYLVGAKSRQDDVFPENISRSRTGHGETGNFCSSRRPAVEGWAASQVDHQEQFRDYVRDSPVYRRRDRSPASSEKKTLEELTTVHGGIHHSCHGP